SENDTLGGDDLNSFIAQDGNQFLGDLASRHLVKFLQRPNGFGYDGLWNLNFFFMPLDTFHQPNRARCFGRVVANQESHNYVRVEQMDRWRLRFSLRALRHPPPPF